MIAAASGRECFFTRVNIGERIREFRKERGLSQVELAGRIGVHQSQISYWERGTNQPSSNALIRIAEALGTSLDHLVFNEARPADGIEDPELYRCFKSIAKLPDHDRAAVRAMLDAFVRERSQQAEDEGK